MFEKRDQQNLRSSKGPAPQDSSAAASTSPKGEGGERTPSISLPKGGGAIRGIGEKFAANPVTGTGSMTVPLPISPGRSGFGPQLTLSYDSGARQWSVWIWLESFPAGHHPQDRQRIAAIPGC